MNIQRFVTGNLVVVPIYPEWGIGVIEQVSDAEIEVRFAAPHIGVQLCTADTLLPHRYEVGTAIFSRAEQAYGTIKRVRDIDNRVMYVVRFVHAQKTIPEDDIVVTPPTNDPFELLRNNHLEDVDACVLGVQARSFNHIIDTPDLVQLSNARIDLVPHQMYVAQRVLTHDLPRFLLADDVGLGKTIEAGLIIKALRVRGKAQRILIIVPSSLVPQWVNELRAKFQEHFIRLDATTLGSYSGQHTFENVWMASNTVVTSLHLLQVHPTYVDSLAQQRWDLIVFDEAHHLRKSLASGEDGDRRSTRGYQVAERLVGSAKALLFLTATPLQLHSFELFSLLHLLDETLFPTFEIFDAQLKQIPALNQLFQHIQEWERLPRKVQVNVLRQALSMRQRGHGQSNNAVRDPLELDTTLWPQDRVRDLMYSLHPLAPAMVRNRKRRVFPDAPRRTVQTLKLQYSHTEQAAYDAVNAYLSDTYNRASAQQNQTVSFVMITYRRMLTSSSAALYQSLTQRVDRLVELQEGRTLLEKQAFGVLDADEFEELEELLVRYGDVVLDVQPDQLDIEVHYVRELCAQLKSLVVDTKVTMLIDVLARIMPDPAEKLIIFTQFRETLFYLQRILSEHYRVATFFGRMDATQKDQVVDEFRNPQGAQILITTDAGGEGRNLQFCHTLVNYDLPWNPMKIEQRIGRIDRIGQTKPVRIYNFVVAGTVEEHVLQVLQERVGLFERSIGSLDPILGTIEHDVTDLLMSRGVTEQQVQEFEERVAEQVDRAQASERATHDTMLDALSFAPNYTTERKSDDWIPEWRDIQSFVARFIEHRGGRVIQQALDEFELHVPKAVCIEASEELRDVYHVTFNPAVLRQQQALDFIAFGHPLLHAAIAESLDNESQSRTAALFIETSDIAAIDAVCAVYECIFSGMKHHKELVVIAVDSHGNSLTNLSERFLSLIAHATACSVDEDIVGTFSDRLDSCLAQLEDGASRRMAALRQRYEHENQRQYEQERQKQEFFWEAKFEAAKSEADRLQRILLEQQASSKRNVQRIVPATEGRLRHAQQTQERFDRERNDQLHQLDQQHSMSSTMELLSAVYVAIRPPKKVS